MSVERNPTLLEKIWRFLGVKGTLYPLGSDGVEVELPVGADRTVLTADSTADGGMSWQAQATAEPLVDDDSGEILIDDDTGNVLYEG